MGEVASLAPRTAAEFNGRSDQWMLVSLPLAATAPMGTIELNANTIKARRLAGAQTIDFPGFMRDAVIAGIHFQCPLFSNSFQVAIPKGFNHSALGCEARAQSVEVLCSSEGVG